MEGGTEIDLKILDEEEEQAKREAAKKEAAKKEEARTTEGQSKPPEEKEAPAKVKWRRGLLGEGAAGATRRGGLD